MKLLVVDCTGNSDVGLQLNPLRVQGPEPNLHLPQLWRCVAFCQLMQASGRHGLDEL